MNLFLSFSDAAKFADVARNFVLGKGWGTSFSFWGERIFESLKNPLFENTGILPLHSLFIALSFKIFGISDFAVIFTSFFFYLLSLVFVFLLARKIFGSKLIAFLSSLAVGFNINLIDYAKSGASESLFIFEILAAFYFASFKKRWASFFTLLFLVLMYFTRTQAFIYILGVILFWLLNNFKVKKAVSLFLGLVLIGFLFDYFVISRFQGRFFIYSVTSIGNFVSLQHSPDMAVSDALRGLSRQSFDFFLLFKKVFYNLYNFYKLMPQILSPYLFAFFVLSAFIWSKNKLENSFKVASIFIFLLTFLVTALSIPFFRYLHPVVPFVYILAIQTLFEILDLGFRKSGRVLSHSFINLTSIILILIFSVGQTLGVLFLDSRFEAKTHNVGKPPVYFNLSRVLKENTKENQVVLTNLDTWGTWYGKRRTVWFPLEPKMIINPETGEIPFDAIYLTSYKIDDPNYYMGKEWRVIFENPRDLQKWNCEDCDKIASQFEFKGEFKLDSGDNYEREEARAVLFIKRLN